jgi:RHS repeat-associated protein
METSTMSIVRRCLRPGSAWLTALLLLMAMVCASMGVAHAAETITYYYTSPQGTVLAKADASGNILSNTDYRPYGTQALGTPEQGLGYTGHVNDVDSGLVYMQARYYDPSVGRFLNVDPAVDKPGTLSEFNRFAYANDNPVSNADLDGRQSVPLEAYSRYWPGSEAEKQHNILNGMAGTLVSIATMSNVFDVEPAGSRGGAVASASFPLELTGTAALMKGVGEAVGLGASFASNLSREAAAANFFRDTSYSTRVLGQMRKGPGEFHAFPDSVTAFAKDGVVTRSLGGDGRSYQTLEIPGSYSSNRNTYDGVFEFIKDDKNEITHRLFVPDEQK